MDVWKNRVFYTVPVSPPEPPRTGNVFSPLAGCGLFIEW